MRRVEEAIRRNADDNEKLQFRFWLNAVVENAPLDPSRTSTQKVIPHWKKDFALSAEWSRHFISQRDASVARETGTRSRVERVNEIKTHEEERFLLEDTENTSLKILKILAVALEKFTSHLQTVAEASVSSYPCEMTKVRRTRLAMFHMFSHSVCISL
jgi:hypothetical protein